MIDGSCFFAIFVGFDLIAASLPTQESIDNALYEIVSTSFDFVSNDFKSDIYLLSFN